MTKGMPAYETAQNGGWHVPPHMLPGLDAVAMRSTAWQLAEHPDDRRGLVAHPEKLSDAVEYGSLPYPISGWLPAPGLCDTGAINAAQRLDLIGEADA